MRPRPVPRLRRLLTAIANSLWVVPALFVVGVIALNVLLVSWDDSDPIHLSRPISTTSAAAALAALGSGMIAFTGFVTTIVLIIVQFGTSEFSPRLIGWFRRDRTLKFALSTFVATFLFALVATAQVGRGNVDTVPVRVLVAALALTLLSIGMFLVLIDQTANRLRVANVAQRLDAVARDVFDTVYPADASTAAAAQQTARSFEEAPRVQAVRNRGAGAVLVTLDRVRLVALARRRDAVIELVPAVGDYVSTGGTLLSVYGGRAISERKLRRTIVLGDERTLDHDPAFALRILVDIAIRALSPAVNDPTTAVQSLNRIEDLLRYAATKELSIGSVSDDAGTTRLVYRTPSWDDLVALGLDEIRSFGGGQYQVARRMRALLDALLEEVPADRRPVLVAQLALLDDTVARRFPEAQRADALVADRQGLGMAQGSRVRSSDRLAAR